MKLKRIIASLVCVLMLTSCSAKSSTKDTSSQAVSDQSSAHESSLMSESTSSASEESTPSALEESSKTLSEGSEIIWTSTPEEKIYKSPHYLSAVRYCKDDNLVLYNDGADIKTAPASITKLLTASVMLRYMDPDDVVTVGTEQYLVNEGSSVCYISIGNRLKVRDLLTGMLLNSGNDAAYTAAVCTARVANPGKELGDREAVEVFCTMMNELAAEIGMNNSHFANPDGWDDNDQYVTAADLVKLSIFALDNPVIREIVQTYQKYVVFESGESITWTNTNALLDPDSRYYCEEAIGMKTGTTDSAGCCLAAAFERKGKTYVSIVTGCYESDDSFELTKKFYTKITKLP